VPFLSKTRAQSGPQPAVVIKKGLTRRPDSWLRQRSEQRACCRVRALDVQIRVERDHSCGNGPQEQGAIGLGFFRPPLCNLVQTRKGVLLLLESGDGLSNGPEERVGVVSPVTRFPPSGRAPEQGSHHGRSSQTKGHQQQQYRGCNGDIAPGKPTLHTTANIVWHIATSRWCHVLCNTYRYRTTEMDRASSPVGRGVGGRVPRPTGEQIGLRYG
jgi:hypothetical protein